MTDEAIILETLKFINKETRYHAFVNINTTLWKDYTIDKQEYLRRLLFRNEFVNQNMDNQWEFRLTAKGDLSIETGELALERDFLIYLLKQSDIEWFMVNHFIKPDPKSPTTINETDNGVNFLKNIKGKGLIDYKKDDIIHVNDWYLDPPKNTIKRWFDTLHLPMLVSITDLGKKYLFPNGELSPIKPHNTQGSTQPANNSHVGIKVWKVLKKIFKIINENIWLATILGGLILYLLIVLLSNHNIKPKP